METKYYDVSIIDTCTGELRAQGFIAYIELCRYIDDGCFVKFNNIDERVEFFQKTFIK